MKIAVIGPGAIGLLFYSRLKLSSSDVYLLDYKKERINFFKKNGIKFKENSGKIHKLKAEIYSKPLKETGLFINAVKSYSVKESLNKIKEFNKSFIISLQNGFGWEEEYRKVFKERFLRGIVLRGSTKKKINEIEEIGEGEVIIEEKNGIKNKIEKIFQKANLKPLFKKNIETSLWKKFILNSSLNPVAGISGLRNGEIYENVYLRKIMIKLGEEIFILARKKKIDISFDIDRELKKVCQKTYKNKNSMLQDLENKNKTEIEFLNGWVLKEAKKYNLKLPYNFFIYNIIKFLENKRWMNRRGV